ncbi:threonine/serine exporter family protein [Vallitalea guaymasensis]|uniref:Threonine/serine exporter family protein n=1 Tax=Vallitalea guaymasensis TaxID=1185412 RepID=A0A8J8MEP2_9FIRM|nr:threonine/serine exporter family protein [Vallitalea guaymasensis]QUH31250.1 threonine/serine exporter family protein [Vallitalea guaymasensis]
MNYKLIFKSAILSGEIMLRNGAETYRVEDTINRILKTTNFQVIESFVTPTGIFATLDDPTIEMITYVKRVNKRTIHLSKVELTNDISRKYCTNQLTIEEAYEKLLEVKGKSAYSNMLTIIATGLAAGFFTTVFSGNLRDFIASSIIGANLALIDILFKKLNIYKFFYDIVGGCLIALIAILFTKLIPLGTNFDLIIIGSIMPLVPGVAFTNAIRDTIEGNLLSGISRGVEALIVAASIATGVGVVLKLYYLLSGGIAI